MYKEINAILRLKVLLNWPYVFTIVIQLMTLQMVKCIVHMNIVTQDPQK